MSHPLGTTTFGFGNYPVGCSAADVSGPLDAESEAAQRDKEADDAREELEESRLTRQRDFYAALEHYRGIVERRGSRLTREDLLDMQENRDAAPQGDDEEDDGNLKGG